MCASIAATRCIGVLAAAILLAPTWAFGSCPDFNQAVTYGSLPARAVVQGDFNHDGLTDLALAHGGYVGPDFSYVSILIGAAGGGFLAPAYYRIGRYPMAIVAGDFNGDGNVDLATANLFSGDISILLGRPNGSFADAVSFPAGSYLESLAVADFNNDHKLDLAVMDSGLVTVLGGNGDGTFAPVCGVAYGTAFTVGDFNGDGKSDVAYGTQEIKSPWVTYAPTISVALGIGDGTFRSAVSTTLSSGMFPNALAVGDFDKDGKSDLAFTDMIDKGLTVLRGDGNGTFVVSANYAAGAAPRAIAVGDLNHDGISDLVVANHDSNTVSVLFGKGQSSFTKATHYLAGAAPTSLTLTDLDRDGRTDIIVANEGDSGAGYSPGISVLFATGDGAFAAPNDYTMDVGALAADDFNGDGRIDLAVTTWPGKTVSILLGVGNGAFAPPVPYSPGGVPVVIATGDFNGDSTRDLAIAKYAEGTFAGSVSILLGRGDGTFGAPTDFASGGKLPVEIKVADLNGDHKSDLLLLHSGGLSTDFAVSVLLGAGSGTFAPPLNYKIDWGPGTLIVNEFNGDGKMDVAAVGSMNSILLFGSGTGTFTGEIELPSAEDGAAGDFNGDGNTDLALSGGPSDLLRILISNGNGSFAPPVHYGPVAPGTASERSVAVADFDRDGHSDVVIDNQLNNYIAVFLGNGDGTFRAPLIVSALPGNLAVADFNGDGKDDIAIASGKLSSLALLLNTCATAPLLTGVSPVTGPAGGGQVVTISGTHLPPITAVTFGGHDASIISSWPDSITVRTRAGHAGTVDIVVSTSDGTATLANAYTYEIQSGVVSVPLLSPTVAILLIALLAALGVIGCRATTG